MSYYFFLSYARSDNSGRKDDGPGYLDKFYADLVDSICSRTGLPEKEIGFRDTSDIEPGEQWPESLAKALVTSRVLVYIHSPTYFNRPMCGKEWQVFHTRIEKYMKGDPNRQTWPPLMIPVLWMPTKQPPACTSKIQYSHEDFGDLYVREGLRYMMKVTKFDDDYQMFIEALAKKVIQVADTNALPELDDLPEVEKVADPFEQQVASQATNNEHSSAYKGPRCAQFIYVAGTRSELENVRNDVNAYGKEGGRDWKPYLPETEEEIAIISQRIATKERFSYELLTLKDNLVDMIRESRDNNIIVILIVDPWTLKVSNYSSVMQEYDSLDFFNCYLLVAFNHADNETSTELPRLQSMVEATFATKITHEGLKSFQSNVGKREELEAELANALNYVRKRIIKISHNIRQMPGTGTQTMPQLDPSGGT